MTQQNNLSNRYDDEISLVDLALMFIRHKGIFLSIVAASLLAGVMLAWFKPVAYTYTTLIEIGTQLVNGELEPLENPASALAKIRASYIPVVLQQHQKNKAAESQPVKVTASVPSDSLLIRMESEGVPKREGVFQTIHGDIAKRLLGDHKTITEVIRKELENEADIKQNDLASAEGMHAVLKNRLQRMEQIETLVKQQVEKFQHLIEVAEQNRTKSINEATDESRAMTLLLINNKIEQYRNQLLIYQERLNVEIPNKRDELQQEIAENVHLQNEIKNEIEAVKLRIANLHETRIVSTATQSIEPTGLGSFAIVALSLLLGVFLGVAAVFMLEFARAAAQRSRELNQ